MESKKINQLATNVAPQSTDLTIIGDPITGVSKKITWLQVSTLIGTAANLQQVTDNGATTTNSIAIGGLTITGLATGVLKSNSGVIASVPFGAANGVATLGGDGKVPSSQLPSYVDDVVEVANYAALPATGETGKIYITLDNNKVYRWTGSIYVEIAANNAVWGAITGTLSNQTDLQNALNAKQNSITLTTTGTSGAATLVGATLNIPNYSTALSGYVPYTGATANVDLGTFNLTADVITGATGSFSSSGGSDTFAINHSSGSGIALNITKGGAGEGLYINKTSGSGNAATIIGTLNATTLVKSGGTSSQFLKADGSVDSSTYLTTSAAASTYVPYTGATTNVDLGIYNMSAAYYKSTNGYVMGQGSTVGLSGSFTVIGATPTSLNIVISNTKTFLLTFPSTSRTYTYPDATGTLALTSDLSGYIQGSGTTNYVPKFTASGTIGNSLIYDTGTRIAIGGTSATYGVLTVQSDAGQFCIQSNTTPGKQLQIGYDHTTNNSYLTSLEQGVAFTTLALQPNGGNVHIGGSTSNGARLQVTGTGTFSGSVTFGSDLFTYANGGIFFSGAATYTSGIFQNASGLQLQSGGSPRLTITSGGNVGIFNTLYGINNVRSDGGYGGIDFTNTGVGYQYSAKIYTFKTSAGVGEFYGFTNDYGAGTSGQLSMVAKGDSSANIGFYSGTGGERMRITGGGEVCVNRTSGSGKFNIDGAFYMYNMTAGAGLSTLKYHTGTGEVTYDTSARIFKKDIVDLEHGLDSVLKMNPKKYKWKSNNEQDLGFIADEMHQVIPEIVFLADNKVNKSELQDGEPMGINYDRLIPVLVNAIQELNERIKQLENK